MNERAEYVLPWFPGKGLTWDEWHAIAMGPPLATPASIALHAGHLLVGVGLAFTVSAVAVIARFSERTNVLGESWYLLYAHTVPIVLVYLLG